MGHGVGDFVVGFQATGEGLGRCQGREFVGASGEENQLSWCPQIIRLKINVAPLLVPQIQELLDFPKQDADGEEEEEAREEDREEDEEVDVRLVLAEEEQALRLGDVGAAAANAQQDDVKAAGFQGMDLVRVSDDRTVSDAPHDQHRLLLPHGDVSDQAVRLRLPYQQGGLAPVAACRRLFPRGDNPHQVHAGRPVNVHHKCFVGGRDVDVHSAKGHVDGDPDVHIGKLGLDAEKNRASKEQVLDVRLMKAVELGRRVEAALLIDDDQPSRSFGVLPYQDPPA
ncbi:hypothetical protein E2320_000713 [Naja naja]|nr:hypothetical protein E2320_000713 [Naja naja]